MLTLVYVLNFLSRQLPGILAKPIQDSLHLSDGQLGRIGGLYFALFYCCISIPVGWLADRTSRSKILALACGIWSAATMCCGGAVSYLQFAVAYMTVGFGEAGGVPPSYSIISDYFPTTFHPAGAVARSGSTTLGRRSVQRWASPLALPSQPLSVGDMPLSSSAPWV
jgi:MFS family permease